ncbi:hypothetical protein BLOT_015227 [Blomia tropicalis]|nr:hypothetical protein BLOT_015227 [Blomia tropicalis]
MIEHELLNIVFYSPRIHLIKPIDVGDTTVIKIDNEIVGKACDCEDSFEQTKKKYQYITHQHSVNIGCNYGHNCNYYRTSMIIIKHVGRPKWIDG